MIKKKILKALLSGFFWLELTEKMPTLLEFIIDIPQGRNIK
jgi:hypothetical protein